MKSAKEIINDFDYQINSQLKVIFEPLFNSLIDLFSKLNYLNYSDDDKTML